MLQAENLSRRYGDFVAVDGVSFAINPGEVVGLLGHNGAGKTTIMKMITAYLEPSGGQVCINGLDVAEHAEQVQSQIGYLPENPPVYPELSVADYLSYAARVRGLEPAAVVPQAVRATQLQEKLLDPIATLSRGFKQRVGVAQAILHKPQFLILDEPTNGLDPSQTQHMRELIRSLAANATVILSTHIMQEVDAVCDRALILRAGKLVVDGRLDELVGADTLRLRASGGDVSQHLSQIADVEFTEQPDGVWLLQGSSSLDELAAATTRALASAGLHVHEVAPVKQDLESVFRQVNEEVA